MITINSTLRDDVIKSAVASGLTTYRFALDELLPLANRFSEQRKIQNRRFYSRLRSDIVAGCVMPQITVAFVDKKLSKSTAPKSVQNYVNENIKNGYILDGLQRLNTLEEASSEDGFSDERHVLLNVIIAERYDLLLYRMITLNNGQKPMTARHQVEMLTTPLLEGLDFTNLEISILSEKDTEGTRVPGSFRKSDIVEAYTAFLTNNVNNQNSKIIDDRLDEIIVGRVMDAGIAEENVSFEDILSEVDRLSASEKARKWLRQTNNLIGLFVGAKKSLKSIQQVEVQEFENSIERFEDAFSAINPSRVNVGKFRRELSRFFFEKYSVLSAASAEDVEGEFFEQTLTE